MKHLTLLAAASVLFVAGGSQSAEALDCYCNDDTGGICAGNCVGDQYDYVGTVDGGFQQCVDAYDCGAVMVAPDLEMGSHNDISNPDTNQMDLPTGKKDSARGGYIRD